jgi:hypothetical protein
MKALCVLLLTSTLFAQPAKHTYTYKVAGDCKIQADAYRAPGDGVRPVILWIQGGCCCRGQASGHHTAN